MSEVTVTTVGHGTLTDAAFADLLGSAGVEHLVDVRSFPGSRRNPQFRREEMERWLPERAVAYSWEPRLGGRRRPVEGSAHVALRNAGFRAYADHMESDEFSAGLDALVERAEDESVAVMCAESVWWRCHRRLLSDALVLLEGATVRHLFHDGRVADHVATREARVDAGRLVYDVGATPPLL